MPGITKLCQLAFALCYSAIRPEDFETKKSHHNYSVVVLAQFLCWFFLDTVKKTFLDCFFSALIKKPRHNLFSSDFLQQIHFSIVRFLIICNQTPYAPIGGTILSFYAIAVSLLDFISQEFRYDFTDDPLNQYCYFCLIKWNCSWTLILLYISLLPLVNNPSQVKCFRQETWCRFQEKLSLEVPKTPFDRVSSSPLQLYFSPFSRYFALVTQRRTWKGAIRWGRVKHWIYIPCWFSTGNTKKSDEI